MIRVLQGDLAKAETAAILRPVSAEWEPVTPATRRLEIAAGTELIDQCQKLGELPVGSAVITSAGALPVEFMVHVVVRSREERVTVPVIQRGLRNGLRRIHEYGISSVTMPPIGTGAGNLDPEEVAEEMVQILLEHTQTHELPSNIDVMVDSAYEKDAFERELKRYELPFLPGTEPQHK
jgi:O-acetyl-ADP-ribose deacetylase